MNDLIKNPLIAFLAGLLILWLAFKLLKVVISFLDFVLAFIILYFINDRFRLAVRTFLDGIFAGKL